MQVGETPGSPQKRATFKETTFLKMQIKQRKQKTGKECCNFSKNVKTGNVAQEIS